MTSYNFKVPKKARKRTLHLPIEQAVYVPTTTDKDKRLSEAQVNSRVQGVRRFFTNRFGGTTSVKAVGTYSSDDGKVIKEPVIKVTSFTAQADKEMLEGAVFGKVQDWAKDWKQESVSYEFEGDLYIVSPKQ